MIPPPVAPSSSRPPLGRKRSRNHDLPPHMARKGQSYYYVCNRPRRWIPLGNDLSRALVAWARYEGAKPAATVGELVERYVDLKAPEWAASTVKQYRVCQRVLGDDFPIPADELTAQHVALWRDLNLHRKVFVNQCISVGEGAYRKAVEWGVCQHNPFHVDMLDAKRSEDREREMTDEEFVAIRTQAPGWLALAMDLAYLTAARPSDLRSLKWVQVGEVLSVRQQKTGAKQAFVMSPELAEVIERAKQRRILGLYVVADDKGRRIGKDRLERAFKAAREAAGCPHVQFRDIRAKSATEAERRGQDYQRLLGHTSAKMSERYLRGRRVVSVEPVRRKL